MRFDLVDLRLFLSVIEAGSITGGAKRAGLALASASERVRGMEETLGTPLLERGRRGVRPTPAGQALAHHARVVLQQIERMRGELGEYARGVKVRLRLLANTAALTEFLPEPLADFLAANPNVDIDLEERLSHEIVRMIAEGLGDVGIVTDTADLTGLETRPFRVDQLVLVVPRGHPLARARRIALQEVGATESFVGLRPGSPLQEYIGRHATRTAGQPPGLRVRVSGFEAVCRMVERGVGLAVVPQTAARRCQRGMAIRSVPLTDGWALRRLSLCMRRLDVLPLPARRLVEHLTAPA